MIKDLSNMNKDICICMIFGLPGSGKTFLADLLIPFLSNSNEKNKTAVLHLNYDALLRDQLLETKFATYYKTETDETTGWWKEERNQVLRLVEHFIDQLRTTKDSSILELTSDNGISESLQSCFVQKVESCFTVDMHRPSKIILIVDDNFHLHSMRYDYFKIARKYHCGFCQVFMKCPTDYALSRNSLRDQSSRVSEEVILRMADRLEPPNVHKFYWEANTLIVDSEQNVQLSDILDLIDAALASPAQPAAVPDDDEIAESQKVCSSSLLHQVDLILRQCISSFMASGKKSWPSGSLRQISKKVSAVKEDIIKEFREAKHNAALQDVTGSVENASKEPESDFYLFVKKLFLSKVELEPLV